MSTILIVDDEEAVCWALERALNKDGHHVAVAASAEDAFVLAKRHRPDAIVLDVRLPGLDGLSAMAKLNDLTNNAPVIVITAFGNLSTAVKAEQNGAFEYLVKPFDLGQCLDIVTRALQRQKPQPSTGESTTVPEEIVGRSPAMQTVFKRIALVAPRDSCVLITGESGTGKELVARALHRYSPRAEKPFLPIHVAALNPNLVESELFGHVRGAFTGATQSRPGLLMLADGGTVFLDELAEIPPPVQVKLLRVLEHNEVLPVGATQPQPLNIRILSATHQDLSRRMTEGSFREDLYFRLNVFQIHLPPLRDRGEDVGLLAEHFLRRFEARSLPLRSETLRHLESQLWAGNVRELRNALEHAAIVARGGPLSPEHFPRPVSRSSAAVEPTEQLAVAVRVWMDQKIRTAGDAPSDLYAELLQTIEPPAFEEVMKRVQGNRWLAAKWLGLNRATVRRRLAKYFPSETPDDGDDDNGDETS
jgi:two-component system nitrogen regulation response regulator GlnG